MKRTKLRRLLPLLLTLLTVIACIFGITVMADEEEVVDTRSSQIKHVNLVLDNNVDIIFWADISEETAQNSDTFMTFNDGAPVRYAGTQSIDDVTYALYRYNNVRPQDLGDLVVAKLYVGNTLTSTLTYSVKNYCQYILTNAPSASLKTLVSDLLMYGMETQALNNESEEEFVTNSVVGLSPSKTPSDMLVLYDNVVNNDLARGETASISSSNLSMSNGIELTFNVDLPAQLESLSGYTACMTVNGREQEVKLKGFGLDNFATLTGIHAYELFDNASLSIYKDNVRVSNSMNFSLASYINALSMSKEYHDIATAFYNYCYSAHVYAGTHTVEVPGTVESYKTGTVKYDDNGYVTYTCSLCGEVIKTLQATHIRNYDDLCSNGSPANTAGGGSLFTISTETEAETSNKYLSVIRDEATNIGSGSFGYYFAYEHSRIGVIGEYTNEKTEYTGNAFTFSFDIKAPDAGLGQFSLYLQNTNTSGTGRYGIILDVLEDGSITRSSTRIAPAGTVNKNEWTNITVTVDFYTSYDTPYIYYEYYVNGELMNSISAVNSMYNYTFTRMYFSAATSAFGDGQGFLLDNAIFAQGSVHSFAESVAEHVVKLSNGGMRQVIDKIQNDFSIEDFSYVVRWDGKSSYTYKEYQSFRPMDTEVYQDPATTPKSYDHPRLLFNTSDIPAIVENIEREENAKAKATFLDKVSASTDGKLTPTSEFSASAFEYTNYDTGVLRIIEAKALYYALYKNDSTGNYSDAKLRGYQAIYAMKNYLLTFDVQWKASDQCRYYGEVMYYSALVYDWCYDLLTDEDKDQFRLGVQNLACDGTNNQPWLPGNTHEGRKLEGGFPALAVEQQSALTGHGAEAQVLRDYFAFAVAIYDEDSTWYDYVGGMIYQNYVDARNYFYSSGYYPDGAAGYNVYRYVCDLYNAWIFNSMGVELPYNEEDMATVIHGLVSLEINDNFMFATADGSGTSSYGQYRLNTTIGDAALISSYLFNDDAALAIAERLCAYEYNRNGFSHQLGISCAYYLILTANDLVAAEDYREKISNVEYHGGFQQQVVSRNNKDEDGVVVLMQGAQHLPGGHTHQNAGNFQIWYKGMLTRDDGLYDAYGSDHHFYYHMSATAHNSLLIYNNNYADSPTGPTNKKLYNGGQKYELGVPVNYSQWINNEKFSFGQLIGIETDDENNPTYVYFANDITAAYDDSTVDYVERSFMTLYTGDAETPMVMFVFDNITSDRANYQKTFLLQCVEEPLIDYDNKTVTVDNGEGKLVLTSLSGADNIYAYGRTSTNGVVDSERYADGSISNERFYLSGAGTAINPGGAESIGDKNSDLGIVWGHVEIQPNAVQETNYLMNVFYVSDSGTTVSATPTLVEGTFLTGATFKNYTSVFVNDVTHSSDNLSFTTTGEGTMTYYVGGLTEGEWKVSINGEYIGNYTATSEGKMLTFTGDVGTVQLEPGESMRPAGTSLIYYNLNGGKLPEDAPTYYMMGETTALPTPTKTDSVFNGWFLDKEFTEPISEIPATATGTLRLYAKWTSPIIKVDYTTGGTVGDHGQVTYNLESSGGSFKMVNSPEKYLLWTTQAYGSIIGQDGKYANYANQSLKVSFSLTFAKNGADSFLPIQIYLRDGKSSVRYLNIFQLDANGNAYLGKIGDKYKFDQVASSGTTTIRFVLDFEVGRAYAYDENANRVLDLTLSEIGVNLPREYSSYEEWFRNLDATGSSLITMKGQGAGTIRIYGISVWAGDISESCRNFGMTSTAHNWDNGVLIREASDDNCTPGAILYTCQDCELTREVPIVSEKPHTKLSLSGDRTKFTYTCDDCGCVFSPAAGYYLDGADYTGMIGSGNANNYNTLAGTHQPITGSGYYELLNKTGKEGDLQLWIPSIAPVLSGFSTATNAMGFASFKVNALTEDNISFNFVDTNVSAERWSEEWCMTDAFLNISAPTVVDGETVVKLTGWDGIVLKTVSGDDFTGWIDVKVCIQLNPENDSMTLHYYIDGDYVASVSKTVTTADNAINSICISGSTSKAGSGIMLDDVAFGYTPNGKWTFEE